MSNSRENSLLPQNTTTAQDVIFNGNVSWEDWMNRYLVHKYLNNGFIAVSKEHKNTLSIMKKVLGKLL